MTSLEVIALEGLPLVKAGDDLAELIASAFERNGVAPRARDVLVVAQKIVSKAEASIVDLATVEPSAKALELARRNRQGPAARRGDPFGVGSHRAGGRGAC